LLTGEDSIIFLQFCMRCLVFISCIFFLFVIQLYVVIRIREVVMRIKKAGAQACKCSCKSYIMSDSHTTCISGCCNRTFDYFFRPCFSNKHYSSNHNIYQLHLQVELLQLSFHLNMNSLTHVVFVQNRSFLK